MKKHLLTFVLTCSLLFLLSACGESAEQISAEEGDISFSAFSAVDFSGEPVDQTVFADRKLTMINIWATYCGPCVREMPTLAGLYESWGDEFGVIGIPLDVVDQQLMPIEDKLSRAKEIIADTGADYPHLPPSASLVKIYLNQVQYVPQTIFVDRSGRQIGSIYSGAKDEKEWAVIINALLEEIE